MPEVEILPACDHYGIGVAPYSPIARGVLTGKYRADGGVPEGLARRRVKDARIMETEFRDESFAIAAEARRRTRRRPGRTLTQFALAWLWANRIVTSIIAGPRTLEQWQDYVAALGTAVVAPTTRRWSTRWCGPATRRRPATPTRATRRPGASSTR